MTKLRHISGKNLRDLRQNIEPNLHRYKGEDFTEIADELHWDVEVNPALDYDQSALNSLKHDKTKSIADQDRENSLIVGEALCNLTPRLACSEVIWVRLCHIDALNYCRERWFAKKPGLFASAESKARFERSITTHMFCPTATAVRDDNALSRLWWNYHIAKLAMPSEPDRSLYQILKTADIRSNLVERPYTGARVELLKGIILFMEKYTEVSADEKKFREFCKHINSSGTGVLFEEMSDAEINHFCKMSWDIVK
jgi:hypothetical protein